MTQTKEGTREMQLPVEKRHTPGPWESATTGDTMALKYSQPYSIAQRGEMNLVAGVFGDVRGGEAVALANARLIAASPLLLDALREIADYMPANERVDAFGEVQQIARKALAKAEGR